MQKLNFEQIKVLVHGATRIEEKEGDITLLRFTEEQQELYQNVSYDFYEKTHATAGITLEFFTNSENLTLSVTVDRGSSRRFFTHSIFVDDVKIGELSGNIGEKRNISFKKNFVLKKGFKKVKILFPWSVASRINGLFLDENANIIPIEKKRKILMFGDSITQGYDAYTPENAYAVQIVNRLDWESRNKAIAGEQFFPALALTKEDYYPDLITVAYGTNDWKLSTKEEFEKSCISFYQNLRKNYPNVKIIALTPIWRADINEKYTMGLPHKHICDYIKKVAENVENMTVIDCSDFVPKDPSFYQTDGLHPIDKGFLEYSKNLWEKFKTLI